MLAEQHQIHNSKEIEAKVMAKAKGHAAEHAHPHKHNKGSVPKF